MELKTAPYGNLLLSAKNGATKEGWNTKKVKSSRLHGEHARSRRVAKQVLFKVGKGRRFWCGEIHWQRDITSF